MVLGTPNPSEATMSGVKEKTFPDMIGVAFLLWRREWRSVATTSSRVGTADGWVVLEEIPVTVVEQRNDVPGMFRPDSKYMGLKARAEDGREFTRNWESYPDDAMTGATHRWYHVNAEEGAPFADIVDAILATSIFSRAVGGQCYDEQGAFKVPTGAEICPLHGDTFLTGQQCSDCHFDELLVGSKGKVAYIACPFCDAQRRAGDYDKDLRGLHIHWDHPEQYLDWLNQGHDPNDWDNIPA